MLLPEIEMLRSLLANSEIAKDFLFGAWQGLFADGQYYDLVFDELRNDILSYTYPFEKHYGQPDNEHLICRVHGQSVADYELATGKRFDRGRFNLDQWLDYARDEFLRHELQLEGPQLAL